MRKHWKLTLIALAAVLVLTVALTTNVFAQEEASSASQGPLQTFISKVATILGIDEAQVTAAVKQAAQETQDEMVQQRLQKAVDNGNLTEEQATDIQEWWQDRPEALQQSGALGRFGMMKGGLGPCYRGGAGQQRLLDQVFDENITGTIVSISRDAGTITLKTADNTEVTVEYTSKTSFILQGVSAVEAGQTATASCWSDADGNLTAKIVRVNLA